MRSEPLRTRRRPALDRAIALVLTWAIPGSSAWALTPPIPAKVATPPASSRAWADADDAEAPEAGPGVAPLDSEPFSNALGAIAHDDDDDDDHGLRPILECVVRHSSSSYTAYFGFKNETSQSISIPVGSSNAFSPAPQNRSQPTTFPKGRSPYHPNAAFSVPFNGSNLTWTLRGPGHHARSVTARASSPRCQAPPSPTPTPTATPSPIPTPTPPLVCASPVYGPTRFTRTCDDHGPTVYNKTFALPAGASGPFTLRVRNGDTQGRNKATAAEVTINGVAIVGDSDFSNNVVTFTKTIATLAATNQLYVRVKGAPGSTFTIEICGANQGDAIPPAVEWLTPLEGEILRDPAPLYRVRYSDAGSGLALSTLKVLVDGADQTAAFNAQPDEASYDSTAALADGAHTLRAEIKDLAGNTGAATRTFRVDATVPVVAVAEPASGSLTRVVRPQIRLTFADGGTLPSGVDPATLSVSIDGVDVTSAFSVSGGGATGIPPQPLATGSHRIDASISDRVGNEGTGFTLFTIDTVAPVLTSISPVQGQTFGASSVPVLVQYSDDHALNLASFTATLDGAPLALTVDADSAAGTAADLADGPHSLVLSIADQAGNVKTSTVSFSTDTGKPEIFIVPANGQAINSRNPEIVVAYSDAQGIAPGTLKITVNGVVRTAEFTQTGSEARAALADSLPVGLNVISAEVRDGASNLGTTTTTFTVDVTPPVVTVLPASGAFLNDTTPDIEIALQDEATGIAADVTHVFIDGNDVTADFALGAAGARGTLTTPLAEGPHTLEVLAADGAANAATLTTTFHIDLTPPALDFASPRVDGYTNDPTPEIWLRLTDPVGAAGQAAAGIDLASARVYVLSEDPGQPDADITALLTPTAVDIGLRGELLVALGDGSHRLRALVRDAAGNESSLTVGFVVDTEAPTVLIDQPQSGTFLNSAEPTIVLLYGDTRSGVASDLVQLTVDGVERAASLVPAPGGATLTLSRSLGFDLADGPHVVEARVVDLAGNATDAAPVTFGVDTVAPVAAVQAPLVESFIGTPSPAVRLTVTDPSPSAGLNAAFATVLLDGIDVTAAITFTTAGGGALPVTLAGEGTLLTPLADGLHTLRLTAIDNANNPVELITQFTVDTAAPVVTPEIPEGGSTVGGGGVSSSGTATITGTLFDLDPGITVTCSVGATSVAATVANGSYSCAVPVSEGSNQVTVTVTDSTGHTTSTTRELTVDRNAPVVAIDAPTASDATNASFITVMGHVEDATAVTVTVGGIAATVNRMGPSGPTTFVANQVPVGDGPTATLTATARDAAGNMGEASLTLAVDRTAPVVTIVAPAPGSYLKAGLVEVIFDVLDRTPTLAEVNGVPALDPTCQGSESTRSCRFRTFIPLAGDGLIAVTAVDAAGNLGHAQVTAVLDSAPPNLAVATPAALAALNTAGVRVTGVATDASPVTLSVNGQAVALNASGGFDATVPLGAEGPFDLVFVATDAAGNTATATVTVVVDRTAPAISVASPAEGALISSLPIVVTGTVADASAVSVTVNGATASSGGQAFSASLSGFVDGPVTLSVRAVDAAGNEVTLTRQVDLDSAPPVVAIVSPASGALTRESLLTVAYSVVDRSTTTVTVNGQAQASPCPGVVACERTASVALVEGDNTIVVEATDGGGRRASAEVVVTRDSTAPTLDLQAPETLSRGRTAVASAVATDNLEVASLEVRLESAVVCTGTSSCSGNLVIPDAARAGDALTLTATATDRAGNQTQRTRSLRVTSDGVVVGTVLDDTRSLPLAGASVTLLGPAGRTVLTDATGRYSIPVADTAAVLRIGKAGMTQVERVVSVVGGVGTVPLDARLTPLGPSTDTIPVIPTRSAASGSAGTPGPVSLEAPAASHRVTLLSAQGLPNLLPAGFSPLVAFDWQSEGASGAATVQFATPNAASSLEMVLVRYDGAMHDWRVLLTALVPDGNVLAAPLPGPGVYALVAPDAMSPPMVVSAPGDALTGLLVLPIPDGATSEGRVDPAVLPPSGGTAQGALRLDSTSPLPSGTIVQADVEEAYSLSSGEEASAPRRSMDVIAYKRLELGSSWSTTSSSPAVAGAEASIHCQAAQPDPPGTPVEHLCAVFPITPSRAYASNLLREGRVHLDLLAGREYARGVVGGNEAISVVKGSVRLSVAAFSLPEDTAIELDVRSTFSPFVPSTSNLTPLAEVTLDFFGATLRSPASLTFSNLAAAPGDTLVLARVERDLANGIPRLAVVALGDVWPAAEGEIANRVVTRSDNLPQGVSLPGIVEGGTFVLFRLASPLGFITGITSAAGTPVRAVVSSTSLPFVAGSAVDGAFSLPVFAGPTTLTARVPGSSLSGATTVVAVAGAATVAQLVLEGAVSQATIAPSNGATNVEVNEALTLTSPVALDPLTITAPNIRLTSVPASPTDTPAAVSLRFVLSGSGKRLSIIPFVPATDPPAVPAPPALAFDTTYRLEIAGLRDADGGVVTAPMTTFRTQVFTKKVYDLTAITFSLPDAQGLVAVTAPSGTLDPGTTVLIINGGNGVVVSLTGGNDGELTGSLPATIDDRLFITVTDPFGNATTFERGEFVDAVTGETAVGAFGGRVRGPAGTSLDIPEGALDKGTKFKLDFVTPEALEQSYPGQQPDFGLDDEGQKVGHVGGALKVEVTAGQFTANREMDLLFPVPADLPPGVNPKDAFYYVYQRVEGPCPNGASSCAPHEREYFLRTLDHAFVECEDGKADCDAGKLRVRTASQPFSGFDGALGFGILGNLNPVGLSMNLLIWTLKQMAPGVPQSGVITGFVYQPVIQKNPEGVDQPVLTPVQGARVSGHDAAGHAFLNGSQLEAVTGPDGRYTLFAPKYIGGPFTLSAKLVGADGAAREVTASGFESNPDDSVDVASVPVPLRQYKHRALLNLSFPATAAPPPAPDVDISVCEVAGSACIPRSGLVLVNRALRIRASVAVASKASIEQAEVNGASVVVALDGGDPNRVVYRLHPANTTDFTPAAPGTWVVRVGVLTADNELRSQSLTFRVIGSTGTNDGLPGDAPAVITKKTQPENGAKDVSAANLRPEVYFTEPVRNLIPGVTITLQQVEGEGAGPVEFDLIGVGVVNGVPVIVQDVQPSSLMTSVTLKPRRGLRLGAKYLLSITSDVVDTDAPPKALSPFSSTFETFTPVVQGDAAGGFASPGIGIVGNLAFVVRNNFFNGTVFAWDVSDPMNPKNLSAGGTLVAPRPIDVSADPLGEPLAAVSVISTNASKPSSVVLVDGQNPAALTVAGAVTVASSAQDGFIMRSAFHKGFVYLATSKKGIQVVDVARGKNTPDAATRFQAQVAINTDGQGFGQDAVFTIPYPAVTAPGSGSSPLVNMSDIAAADIQGQALVASTGTLPLLLVNPLFGQAVAHWQPGAQTFTVPGAPSSSHIVAGYAIGLGRVGAWDLAVLVALTDEADPASRVRLFAVDVRDAAHPTLLGSVDLAPQGAPLDVTLRGTTAVVTTQRNYEQGEAIVVELVDPSEPYVKARLTGVGGRAAINADGQIVTTGVSPFGGPNTPIGGIRSLLLDSACTGVGRLLTNRIVQYRLFDPTSGETLVEDAGLELELCQRSEVTAVVVHPTNPLRTPMVAVVDSLNEQSMLKVDLSAGSHRINLPKYLLPTIAEERTVEITVRSVVDGEERVILATVVGEIRNRPMLPVSHTFVRGVDLFDGHVALEASDLQVKGRHFTLDLSRSYSSAGLGEGKSGWTWTYDSVISRVGDLYNVVTADGSSQRFTRNQDGTFTPQKGYHTKLSTEANGVMVFVDKAANRHTFKAITSDTWTSGPWRLASIEEPHGDRLEVSYNKLGRVDSVKEIVKGASAPATTLTFLYKPFRQGPPGQPIDPADVALERVVAEAANRTLNQSVEYIHAENGELQTVIRRGGNIGGGRAAQDELWQYRYVTVGPDKNRIERVIDPDSHVTRYEFVAKDASPSEGDTAGRAEFVQRVIESPGGGAPEVITAFDFGDRTPGGTTFTTTVTDPRNSATTYTMNAHGGVTRIEEPLSRVTTVEWWSQDALKKKETLPGGLVKDYEYDANGNLTKETTTGADGLVAQATTSWNLRFNKPESLTDAEHRTTTWSLDPTTGDVLSVQNGVGDRTTYTYDPTTGLLQSEADPRGMLTTYTQDLDHGLWTARVSTLALSGGVPSVTARRTIDPRGRVTRETDGVGGEAIVEYDGLDRPLVKRRVAWVAAPGGPSKAQDAVDEVVRVQYTAGGQPKTVTNALGAVTTNTIDGMNRVTATSTPVRGDVPSASATLTTATAYDGNGNVVQTTDPRGVVRRMTYDALNRLESVEIVTGPSATGPFGVITAYTYKGATDLKETETDISGNTTTFVYDGLFRMVEKQAPVAGYVERFAYDLVGNQTRATDANGKVTKTDYDGLNRVIRVTRDLGGPSEASLETRYEESSTSHVFKTEEYDAQTKLRVRYATDVAGRTFAVARLLEGEGSALGRASTAGNPADGSANSTAATSFAGGLPAAPAREIETQAYTVGTTMGTVLATILEPSLTRQNAPRTVQVDRDGLGRETARRRGSLPAVETEYNGLSGKTRSKDENGNVTEWRYDTAGRLIGMIDADQKAARYRVDGGGNRIEEIDRRGVVRTFAYDNLGRLVGTSVAGSLSAVDWSERTEYLDAQKQQRVTDALGTATLTQFDGLGRPLDITQFGTETGGGNRTRSIRYDRADKRSETDWMGRITTFEYDGLHRLTKATAPAPFTALTVETVYDDANNRVRTKDRRGFWTVTQKDSMGRVVWVRRGACDANGTAGGECETVERNEYDGSGNRVLTADGLEHQTRFEFDAANRLIAREEGYGASVADQATLVRFELDNGGRVTKEFHGRLAAAEPAVSRDYDKLNRVERERNGEGEETVYGYDAEGNRTSVKPPGQPATTYLYDELGKLTSVTMPPTEDYETPAVTKFGYDKNRNKTSQEDARGSVTTYAYDKANRLKSMLEPGNLETKYDYDANGNALAVTGPKGQTATCVYDELSRKKSTTYAENPDHPSTAWREVRSETFEYDGNDNPLEAHRWVSSGADPPVDQAIVRTFDGLDRQLTETTSLPDGGTKQVSYEYNANGTRRAVTDPDGRRTAYEYDAQNRVIRMVTNTAPGSMTSSEGALGTTTYAYFPDDLVKEVTSPNQVKATSTYDKAGRLLALTNADVFKTVSRYEYEYADGRGNRTKQTETNASAAAPAGLTAMEETRYTYDAANRLKSVTYPVDPSYPSGRVVTYTYDKVGNREGERETLPPTAGQSLGAVIVSRAGVFDPNNRLTTLSTAPGAASTSGPEAVHATSALLIGYDNNGNETTRLSTTYHPNDAEGNPVPPTVVLTQSTYDLSDHLVEQQRGAGIVTRHEYDAEGRRTKKIGEEGIRQYVYDDTSLFAEYDTNGAEVAKYDYGGDRLIRLTRSDDGTRYFSFDGLGSVSNLTTATEVAASYHLDAWGNYRFTSELAPSKNRFGYTGHYWDKEASLYYAKARYYDPFTARFTQADSFLGKVDDPPSLHRYFYANANPTLFWDPTGHETEFTALNKLEKAIKDEEREKAWCGSNPAACATKAEAAERTDRRLWGGVRAGGGVAQAVLGGSALLAPEPTGATKVGGWVALVRGVENFVAGVRQALTGEIEETPSGMLVNEGLKRAGATDAQAGVGQFVYEFGADAVSTGISAAKKGPAASESWAKGPGPRGLDLEFGPPGHRLPKGFKTFDYFDPETGRATSQKSMDLLNTYANPSDILKTGKKAVNNIIDFNGAAKSGVRLTPEQIRFRRLDIIIQPGTATEAQKAALGQLRVYGLDNDVAVRIIEVR